MYVSSFSPYAITSTYLLFLCVAIGLCQTPANEIEYFAQSGNYLIVYCSSGSHATHLQTLIPYMQSELQAVLSDLDRGTASPAYRSFFKTNDSLDTVRQVFTDIIKGSAILSVDPPMPPTLVCADADQPLAHQVLDRCTTPRRLVGFVSDPDKFVYICPSFWTLPRIARKAACPWVVAGKLLTEPWNLRTTQYAVLVHELVHVYNRFDSREEVYDLLDVVGLNASKSLGNAQNFASYAAGECLCIWFV